VGLDLRSIPVRLGSEPARRIREDADLWEAAAWLPPFSSRLYGEEQLPGISLALLAEVPGVQGWTAHFPDRSHQQAEYLLDPRAMRESLTYAERERSLPYRVIFGDEGFAGHARASQGVAWRCSGTAFLRQAAALIDAIDPAAARREFSVAEMYDLGVYKVRPNGDDDTEFEVVLQHLRRLAAYYGQVADQGLDLIFELD
jgi:hypothetical protein